MRKRTKREFQLRDLNSRMIDIETEKDRFLGNEYTEGEFDKLLEYLGIEYTEETKKGYRKINKKK